MSFWVGVLGFKGAGGKSEKLTLCDHPSESCDLIDFVINDHLKIIFA
jgi:hypothetical protein